MKNQRQDDKKKQYQKPCIKYEKKIEAFAAVCTHAGIYKNQPGVPNEWVGCGFCSYLFT